MTTIFKCDYCDYTNDEEIMVLGHEDFHKMAEDLVKTLDNDYSDWVDTDPSKWSHEDAIKVMDFFADFFNKHNFVP